LHFGRNRDHFRFTRILHLLAPAHTRSHVCYDATA
jgi:hypothetical protein